MVMGRPSWCMEFADGTKCVCLVCLLTIVCVFVMRHISVQQSVCVCAFFFPSSTTVSTARISHATFAHRWVLAADTPADRLNWLNQWLFFLPALGASSPALGTSKHVSPMMHFIKK